MRIAPVLVDNEILFPVKTSLLQDSPGLAERKVASRISLSSALVPAHFPAPLAASPNNIYRYNAWQVLPC